MPRFVCLAIALGLSGAFSTLAAEAASPSDSNPRKGSFDLVTYNVAGLPEGISHSHPLANLPIIGKLLNAYDIALVQEDFAYPLDLRRAIQHPHASPPFVRGLSLHYGDGLSQFARLPFAAFRRIPWASCHGFVDSFFDCLTPKGFTIARQALDDGVFVDVYNLHMDAGWGSEDRQARSDQVDQLVRALRDESAQHAVVLGGDTNLRGRDRAVLEHLLAQAGLEDACSRLHCPEPGRVDRVLYRSSSELRLSPRTWRLDREFVDARGVPLSDHLAVAVTFDWQREDLPIPAPVPPMSRPSEGGTDVRGQDANGHQGTKN
jgi:hypothetical protein